MTMMNLIDISSWQKGIDLSVLFARNNLDGVIVKATQGTGYVNPEYAGWVKWLSEHDKPFGVYHYLDGGDAKAEAQHFYNTVKPYIGKCIPVADFEGEALSKGAYWLRQFLERFRELSGVKPMIYCSLSVVQTLTGLTDYPLWIAQYADMNTVNGFLDKPWQRGSVAPFDRYLMHQYTSCGRLDGYGGNLDFNQFNGSYAAWMELCRGESTPAPEPTPAPTLKPADPSIVLAVLKNEYGIGNERVTKLKQAGYDPASVQTKINNLYTTGSNVKKAIGNDISYLNAILWIVRSI